jgi:hypothetical protein
MSVPYNYLFSQLNTLHIIKAGLIVVTVTLRVKEICIDNSVVRYNNNFVWLYEYLARQNAVTDNNYLFLLFLVTLK